MSDLRDRVLGLGRALMAQPRRSPADQRLMLALSAAVFVVATVVAARNLPPVEGDLRWGFFVAVGLLGVPARVWITGEEFGALGRLTRNHVHQTERIRVALVGSAANLLPIPGSVLVRTRVLHRRGAALRTIGWATAITAAMWAGATAFVAGVLLTGFSERRLLGLAATACGAVVCAGVTAAILRRSNMARPAWLAAYLFAVEAGSVLIGGLRMWGIMQGLGYDVGLEQATALTVAGLVTTAVGFAPGGLGVRELVAAAISPIVGLEASVGLMAAALNRLVDLIVMGPASAVMFLRPGRAPAGGYAAAVADQADLRPTTSSTDLGQ